MQKIIILIMALITVGCSTTSNFRFKAPLHKGVVTSNMGGRWGRLHHGVDIGVKKWTVVRATARGSVVGIMVMDRIYGNRVDVYHSDIGLYSSYSHLEHISVKMGQRLDAGDLIGTVGSTGKSTGAHLHFEIYNANGVFINPLGMIDVHNFTYRGKN